MVHMSQRKTTVYLDTDVLTATKVLAATRNRSESQVVEDALRAYLRAGELADAQVDLQTLMDRVARRDDLGEDEAMAVAVDEVRAIRAARAPATTG